MIQCHAGTLSSRELPVRRRRPRRRHDHDHAGDAARRREPRAEDVRAARSCGVRDVPRGRSAQRRHAAAGGCHRGAELHDRRAPGGHRTYPGVVHCDAGHLAQQNYTFVAGNDADLTIAYAGPAWLSGGVATCTYSTPPCTASGTVCTSGTFTFTVPAGVTAVTVQAVGGAGQVNDLCVGLGSLGSGRFGSGRLLRLAGQVLQRSWEREGLQSAAAAAGVGAARSCGGAPARCRPPTSSSRPAAAGAGVGPRSAGNGGKGGLPGASGQAGENGPSSRRRRRLACRRRGWR